MFIFKGEIEDMRVTWGKKMGDRGSEAGPALTAVSPTQDSNLQTTTL